MRNSEVVSRRIAGETILVPVTGNLADMRRLFSLNATAEFVWRAIEKPVSKDELSQQLAAAYDTPVDQAAQDVTALLDELCQAGLVQAAE